MRANPDRFRVMVVKRQMDTLNIRKVCRDIVIGDRDKAVLHIFGMDKFYFIDEAARPEQNGAYQPVKITARHKPVFFFTCCHRPSGYPESVLEFSGILKL
jgi:hypothetical protein